MRSGELIQAREERDGREALTVDGNRVALFEENGDLLRPIRRVLRIHCQLKHLRVGFVPRIFENPALVRGVEQIAID